MKLSTLVRTALAVVMASGLALAARAETPAAGTDAAPKAQSCAKCSNCAKADKATADNHDCGMDCCKSKDKAAMASCCKGTAEGAAAKCEKCEACAKECPHMKKDDAKAAKAS